MESAAIKTFGLTHLALAVSELQTSARFYEQAFGMRITYNLPEMVQLETPGCHDVLVLTPRESGLSGKKPGGIQHFGFRLKSPEALPHVMDDVLRAGGTLLRSGEFVPGSPYAYFADPDGYEIEVWYE